MEKLTLLENLLNKYLQGKLTISERKQFNDLLADDSNETVFRKIILNHISEFTHENSFSDRNTDFYEIYNNILSQLDLGNKTSVTHLSRFRKILYMSVAAAILTGVFMLGRIFPVFQSESNPLIQTSYTEVKSPYGSKSEILLPDGTSVILNAGSTLKYRNDFDQTNRNIDLHGEAYFKVAKNPDIPLVVSAGYIDVIAVGTEFNIKAYPEENTIETTLIEGKVEIANSNSDSKTNPNQKEKRDGLEFIDLEPNQKAIFYKGEEGYILENIEKKAVKPEPVKPFLDNILISPKADVEKTVAWTKGKLIFRGEDLENLCVDLQRKYDVKFVFIDEDLKKYRFTGVLLDETLEQVLGVMKLTAPIDFSIEAKNVYLFTDVTQLDGFEGYLK